MKKFAHQPILNQILLAEGIEYGIFDSSLKLAAASPGLGEALIVPQEGELTGKRMKDLFPELVGSEGALEDILQNRRSALRLDYVHRPGVERDYYVNLQVQACKQGILVILQYATCEGAMSQRLMQQRNALYILASKLMRKRSGKGYFLQGYVSEDMLAQISPNPILDGMGGEYQEATGSSRQMEDFDYWAEEQNLKNLWKPLRPPKMSLESNLRISYFFHLLVRLSPSIHRIDMRFFVNYIGFALIWNGLWLKIWKSYNATLCMYG